MPALALVSNNDLPMDAVTSPLPAPPRSDVAALLGAAEAATRRIAPLWPLKHFVAVNPFLGLAERRFGEAAATMARAAGARMLMPRDFYASEIASGRVTDADLSAALKEVAGASGLPEDVAALKIAAASPAPELRGPLPTVAEVALSATGTDWPRFVTERVSAWASAHFDQGQSSWRSPWRDLGPYAAWRAEAVHDRTAEVAGLPGFRRIVASLPESADGLIARAGELLGIGSEGATLYFHRLLMTVGGWAAYVRYLVWETELYGGADRRLVELLAVRLAWEVALLQGLGTRGIARTWEAAREDFGNPEPSEEEKAAIALDLVLQSAYERAWQRELIVRMSAPRPAGPAGRKAVQAAFCIDVRSEVYRRAFEAVSPEVETIGFAGFFGFPIEYVPLGHDHGGAQCPVLLTPKFTVREAVKGADGDEETEILGYRMLRRKAGKLWKSFKVAAVSSFGFVETMGLLFAPKLATDSLRLTRTVTHPSADGLDGNVIERLGPSLAAHEVGGRQTGFDAAQRLAMAEAVLKAMSMTENFARLVMLTGHGSTTVNNPHATGLDCGACGGHTGEANARVAAAILNDKAVRAGLKAKGLPLPDDTVFLGCLHDTTTDEVLIYDEEFVPESHAADLERLKAWLAEASRRTRVERSLLLRVATDRPVDAEVIARSRDWSQVRPEWGLAGCAGFIAAPRAATQGLDLAGRCFLHSYDWRKDEGFPVLELIMTAPMVVASWISLQYYGSTVDNRAFGSGNKVLHNVVGTLGVLEGNGGDLRVGLPWQSVHDGEKLIHEPRRLSVMIAAPIPAMNEVIGKHAAVRDLLDNGWLFLFAIDDGGRVTHRYKGGLDWEDIT